jgi:hypothetical protein
MGVREVFCEGVDWVKLILIMILFVAVANTSINMRFEVITAVNMWAVFFRVVTPCSLVGGH